MLLGKVSHLLGERWGYWHPSVADQPKTARLLAEFYANRSDYHAMTAKPEKRQHPQIQLLLDTIRPADVCVEFGCGGGVVLEAVAEKAARAIGMDVASLGLRKTRARLAGRGNSFAIQSDVASAPLKSGIADVAYSCEVLEHVWNPEAVILEMIRVLRPGGILFITTPNGFSLDLHLNLRPAIRAINLIGAAWTYVRGAASPRIFRNMEPDLTTVPSYSDCDMITKIFPPSLGRWLGRQGCSVERLETFFFQKAKAPDAKTMERTQHLGAHPFFQFFGDHILLVARKASPSLGRCATEGR
jgi:2-polyprenyl-3-methyl-5-hydroxy-6-metoxy-1,4-benzoquinol methylase